MSGRREARAADMVARREAGQTLAAIGAAHGVTGEYARQIVEEHSPGIGARVRAARLARREAARVCPDCGAVTSKPGVRCLACATPGSPVFWTREAIIERIQAWVETYGSPPGARDWNPGMARGDGREDIAERFESDGCWPYPTVVLTRFGTWNAAIRAAGFVPREAGKRGRRVPPAVSLLGGDA